MTAATWCRHRQRALEQRHGGCRAGWLPQRRRRSRVRWDEWPPVGGW